MILYDVAERSNVSVQGGAISSKEQYFGAILYGSVERSNNSEL